MGHRSSFFSSDGSATPYRFFSPWTLFLLFILLTATCRAEDRGPFPDVDPNDPASLQEVTRVLQEEVKLAARPHNYLLIDLVTRTIHIKGRGLDLYRIPIAAWSIKASSAMHGTHRLIARPPIARRTVDPTVSVEQIPLSLADMPTAYTLSFTPALTIEVRPSDEEGLFHRLWAGAKTWWRSLTEWASSFSRGESSDSNPYLLLELSREQAQSLAWSAVDGMPLVIRRATDKK
ncbi:protein of unknown function [Candidatus Nitrospira inopinata]|uniref:Uncharacterized protein n=1 Tax=Candidatus Nitrospira inopinata TaxID=1715989 RepID=A0A0S4KRU7_9BACT|nr:protein of unknown function [Candidatus Nitrospira inopinata]